MKSPWFWILGGVIGLLIFSGGKNEGAVSPGGYEPELPKPSQAYQQPGITNDASPTFMDAPCTSDCSGHEAGYEWAEDNGIDDPDDCGGNSDSFIEGCQAYVEEQQAAVEESSVDE